MANTICTVYPAGAVANRVLDGKTSVSFLWTTGPIVPAQKSKSCYSTGSAFEVAQTVKRKAKVLREIQHINGEEPSPAAGPRDIDNQRRWR
jgi:hypothetical protein